MICDSQWGFEFSGLNSLLSCAFSQQDKIKVIEIIKGSVTFKKHESYYNTLNTELCWLCFCFSYWLFLYCSQSSQLIWKNIILEFSKNMIISPLIWVFDFIGWFSNYNKFDEIKWFCVFTKDTTQKFITKPHLHLWVDINSI